MGEHKEYVTLPDEKGQINISEDVIAVVASAALLEVDGVAGAAANLGKELGELLGRKNASKGVKLQMDDGGITVDTFITVLYGHNITKVSAAVQDAIASAVESMTGLTVNAINVNVCGVAFEKGK